MDLKVFEKYLPYSSAIFLRGSQAEGFAGPTSDIDGIVITNTPQHFNCNYKGFDLFRWGGVNVEVLVLTEDDLYSRLNILKKNKLSQKELDEVERILSAKLIYSDNFSLDLDVYRKNFCLKYIDFKIERCRYLFVKIKNSYNLLDYQLIHLCRKYVLSMMEAYLVLKGDIFTRERWLFKRMNRTLGETSYLVQCYNKLVFQQACVTLDEIQNNARQLLFLAQRMQYAILTNDQNSLIFSTDEVEDSEPAFFLDLGNDKAAIIYMNDLKVDSKKNCLYIFKTIACKISA